MDIIPVIDLKDGQVVHARAGQRASYRPIETPLSASSRPLDVVAGLMQLAPFRRLYVADLDAITGEGENTRALAALAATHPGLELWVDNGIAREPAARAWLDHGMGALVLGSESQSSTGLLRALAGEARVVLSLDYRGDAFQGPEQLAADRSLWPSRVIVMTLARVGTAGGPDVERVANHVGRASASHIYGAGGVRNAGDLAALQSVGAAGALVATALHAGALSQADLGAWLS
jgi:phosphoribosylformimino-5-aminoimidazole carboxamide ribotide isomerase